MLGRRSASGFERARFERHIGVHDLIGTSVIPREADRCSATPGRRSADEEPQRAQAAERERRERRRPCPHLDAAVLAEWYAPSVDYLAKAMQRLAVRVKPESGEPHGDACTKQHR